MSIPKILDNNRASLLNLFNEIAHNYDEISIATGYWDLAGTQLLIEKLNNYQKIRLLIGREPSIPRDKRASIEPDFPDEDFYRDLQNIPLSPLNIETVKQIKQLIDSGKLEVKVYTRSFLHAKCYIFGNYSSNEAVGVIGSSNFTKNGLTVNTELNAVETDHRIVTFRPQTNQQEVGHLFWFDQFWNDELSMEWSGQFKEILADSPVGDILFSPYESYIKTLYELYKEELEDENLDQLSEGQYTLHQFQLKNVNALLRRLRKYHVAMLSDSVGLGKTVTAIEVIRRYLDSDKGKQRVEIICPKSLKNQWVKELSAQSIFNLMPITLQNLQEIEEKEQLDHIASVSLFVFDESHNLKNRSGRRFDELLKWIRNNPKADVLLLTATPINNQLSDVTNQILLGTRGETNILKVTVIDKNKQTSQISFHDAVENLKKKINKDLKRDGIVDYDYIQQVMRPILREFIVRRTRQGIQKEYGDLFDFPSVVPEVKKYRFEEKITASMYQLCESNDLLKQIYALTPEQILDNTRDLKHPLDQIKNLNLQENSDRITTSSPIYFVYLVVLLLGFLPYRWKLYQTKYYGKTKQQIGEMKLLGQERKLLFLQLSIYGILRTMFLKRMESSVSALRSSVNSYIQKLNLFERGISEGKIISLADVSGLEEIFGIDNEDLEQDTVTIGDDHVLDEIDVNKYNLDALKNDINQEKKLLDVLCKQLDILESDSSKIKSFVELLDRIRDQHKDAKVLVFSYFADTIDYLQRNIPTFAPYINEENCAFISSRTRNQAEDLASRFSPRSKKYTLNQGETELTYLFSTDVLSEGQNLQDCGILVNFDLHWNPVRMIQRNGRVNRLNSQFKKVFIYNITPESQLEEYLRLVHRLESKINLIRNTVGTDSPVLDEIENPLEFVDSIKDVYSDDFNLRMKALENAEREADILLSEDEYISDLKIFHNNSTIDVKYKQKIYKMPRGKWCVMPTQGHQGASRPEVLIFNTVFGQDSKVSGHIFSHSDKDGNNFQAVPTLQALEWLRTNVTDTLRQYDAISINKHLIADLSSERINAYFEVEELGSPIGQQADILRIMHENHYEQSDIELVEQSFRTSNEFDKQLMIRLTRNIVRAKRDNLPYLEFLHELVTLAHDRSKVLLEQTNEHGETEQTLFYARVNQ